MHMNLRSTVLRMMDVEESGTLDIQILDGGPVVSKRDSRRLVHLFDFEGIVSVGSRLVASLRSRNAFDELVSFEALYLVANRTRVAVDALGDGFPLDCGIALTSEIDQYLENLLLTLGEFNRYHYLL
jgi:hypothetical protein